jgi:hypothetical protein
MSMRNCGRCGQTKADTDFAWRRKWKGQRDNMCRPCRAAYKQEHYRANKQRYVDNAARRRERVVRERVEFLLEYFKDHPCVDCGETDPLVLEFDHIREKSFDVGKGLRDRGWQSILDEIAKCDVVCANCHRRRTARRGGFIKVALMEVRERSRANL